MILFGMPVFGMIVWGRVSDPSRSSGARLGFGQQEKPLPSLARPGRRPAPARDIYTPSAVLIAPAIPCASAFIFSSDSASIMTRASASVPE